jgi:hypothetical protein
MLENGEWNSRRLPKFKDGRSLIAARVRILLSDSVEPETEAETINLMAHGTISRIGDLSRVFKGGNSELMNGIARLCVLYEDLRLEMSEFKILHGKVIVDREPGMEYRVMYFLRRALATLIEFRGGLTTVLKTAEFKAAKDGLSGLDARSINDADTYLQKNWSLIKKLRNEFAGHVQMSGVEFAISKFSNETGRVTWHRGLGDGWTMGLECDFAGKILAGAIGKELQAGADAQTELRKALEVITPGYTHAQAAMCALVHAFLWDRFGSGNYPPRF